MDRLANLIDVLSSKGVVLVAVSKTKSTDQILELYNQGQRDFGENRVQELVEKYVCLPQDIRWHQIGHLQKNKVKLIVPFVHLIHSVDSREILEQIQKHAAQEDKILQILLQVKIAKEETKFGLSYSDALKIIIDLQDEQYCPNILLKGLMGMASFSDDQAQVRKEFSDLKSFFDDIKQRFFVSSCAFDTLSMGMSGDYAIAITEGSTMVRLGSLLFGSREV